MGRLYTVRKKNNMWSWLWLRYITFTFKVTQSCLTLCDPMYYAVHGILQARKLEWVAFPFSRESSQPRDRIQVSRIAGRFFTSWAIREAQEYWGGYLSILQGIFPTPESNQGLLHCRGNLYQLSYQGSQKSDTCSLFPPVSQSVISVEMTPPTFNLSQHQSLFQ